MSEAEAIAFREQVMLLIHRQMEKHGKAFNATLLNLTVEELKAKLNSLGGGDGYDDRHLNNEITAIVSRLCR